MIDIDQALKVSQLRERLSALWGTARASVESIQKSFSESGKTPVFTISGKYSPQGWTEWTQGFQFGSALLLYDVTDDEKFLRAGRDGTLRNMATHVSHIGVHDHGFNNVSTYGNLWRLHGEGRAGDQPRERELCELALKVSGAVQASRWTKIADGRGFIYSFNGPHSLFSDTIRSLRVLALAHLLGHRLWAENDRQINLLTRLCEHAQVTAEFNVYYGAGRDMYDVPGRVAHESIFNTNDGMYRCPSTQQGYSPFSTWTRGLAWIMLGYAEQLEFLDALDAGQYDEVGGQDVHRECMLRAARATCDFYIAETPTDGIPYWDTGAPGLALLQDANARPADPLNAYEPVDSSAAAIAAQGLLRLGHYLQQQGDPLAGARYWSAGLTVARRLLGEPYLNHDPQHQGILLHAVYHRPRGWDHIPPGASVPLGEACMWGDYHLLELGVYLQRMLDQSPYLTFFSPPK